MMKCIKCVVFAAAVLLAGVCLVVWCGMISVAADVPHHRITYQFLEFARERSIARSVSDIEVPDLSSPGLLLAGGPDYNDMCATCHLQPGQSDSDMSVGLYPVPPNLSSRQGEHSSGDHDDQLRLQRQFWVIKHGIKASGMPAWGLTHDDQRIWAMVAFLQKLPQLNPQQYQILTARGESP